MEMAGRAPSLLPPNLEGTTYFTPATTYLAQNQQSGQRTLAQPQWLGKKIWFPETPTTAKSALIKALVCNEARAVRAVPRSVVLLSVSLGFLTAWRLTIEYGGQTLQVRKAEAQDFCGLSAAARVCLFVCLFI